MIYLPYTSLITHIISYNKMLIIYHVSALKTHLSNIHLIMAQINTYTLADLYGRRDYYKPPHTLHHDSPTPHAPSPHLQLPHLKKIRCSVNWCV